MNQILKKLNCNFRENQAGMFVWARVPKGEAVDFCDRLLAEKSIFITPGFIFGEEGKNYVRVSLCSSTEKLDEVLNRIS